MGRETGKLGGVAPNVRGYRRDEIRLDGEVYMRRWYPGPGPRLRYHEILRSDPDRDLHDHPWDFTSLILEGAYVEITPDGERRWQAGDVIRRRATDLHRLELDGGPVWTQVRTGPVRRWWGFQTADGWVDARRYDRTLGAPSRPW